jgi:hypothetical protein
MVVHIRIVHDEGELILVALQVVRDRFLNTFTIPPIFGNRKRLLIEKFRSQIMS